MITVNVFVKNWSNNFFQKFLKWLMIVDSASNSEIGAVVPVLEAAQELLTFNGNQ